MTEVLVIDAESELHRLAQNLLDAAVAYRNAAASESYGGAVMWLDASDGFTVICTRGDYRQRLMMNIDKLRAEDVVATFAHVTTNADTEAEFEGRTPDGFT